jgi:hypothetical protein
LDDLAPVGIRYCTGTNRDSIHRGNGASRAVEITLTAYEGKTAQRLGDNIILSIVYAHYWTLKVTANLAVNAGISSDHCSLAPVIEQRSI